MKFNNTKSVYIIAEAGVNHNGKKDLAYQLIDAAAEARADAVKFQTFKAVKLASQNVDKAPYQKLHTDTEESQLDMLTRLELPYAWHTELQQHANSLGIEFLSTAFDEESLDFLMTLNLPFLKIPSGELTNSPLLWRFARTKKPLVISTGMATLSEVEFALAVVSHGLRFTHEPKSINEIWQHWAEQDARKIVKEFVTLLHCTSQYPTNWNEVNLKAIDTLATVFDLPVGYSDHTQGLLIPIAAVARGAKIIEKHFTLDKSLSGPDHKASLDVSELKKMIIDIRSLELALGDGFKYPQASENETRKVARQTIIASRSLSLGQKIERSDLTTARVGHGLPPSYIWELIGTPLTKSYAPGEVLELC